MFFLSLFVLLAIVLSVLLRYADYDCSFVIFKLFDNRRLNGLFHKVCHYDSYCDMCFVVTFLVTSVVFGTVVVTRVSIVASVVFGIVVVSCVSIVAFVVLGTVVVKSLLFQQLLV
jgi:hypothetical protein